MDRLTLGFQAPKNSLFYGHGALSQTTLCFTSCLCGLEKQPSYMDVRVMSNREVLERVNEGQAHVGLIRYPISRGEEIAARLRRMGLQYRRWLAVNHA
jgi:hypothetical protein